MDQNRTEESLARAFEILAVVRPATVEEVDETGYLRANPDIKKKGISAADHFLEIGRDEGRRQYVNFDQVAALREAKLKRIKFRRAPIVSPTYGEPLNFLTSQLMSEFGIPEAPPESANQYGGPFIEEISLNPNRLCLDLGAGLRYSYSENIVNVEIFSSYTTDVICVGEDLPFESEQFDYVICAAVLEHTLRPWDVAREICRVLKPGGKVLIDFPFLQAVHGYPHHYFNATPKGAISLFEEHCTIVSSTIELNNHPIQSLWWILAIWESGLADMDRSRFNSLRVEDILALSAEKHLSEGYCKNLNDGTLRTIPAGSTLVAQKKMRSETDALNTNHYLPLKDEELARSYNELTERVGLQELEIVALRESRSWRLTKPLRLLSELFKRG